MVEGIETLQPHLKVLLFRQCEGLVQAKIDLVQIRLAHTVSARPIPYCPLPGCTKQLILNHSALPRWNPFVGSQTFCAMKVPMLLVSAVLVAVTETGRPVA